MRPFLQRHIWAVLGITTLVLVLATIAVGAALLRKTGDADPSATSARHASQKVNAYVGLGAWVDLWDARAWRDPVGTVRDMASHGVRTLYLQTATAKTPQGIPNPTALSEFITEAHARHMSVVAWYLPGLQSSSVDFDRVIQAAEFRTGDGQKFDSVALDIESTTVKSIGVRNRNLASLSEKVRRRVGASYPLGGIIPSPVGLRKKTGFWDRFPYGTIAASYDVVLPMAYYTFHGHTSGQARADAVENMRILRAQPGCSAIPVHLIGGIAGTSSAAQVRAFARAARDTGCIGASIYDWVGTNDAKWQALAATWKSAPS
jgi:hypothetical protein